MNKTIKKINDLIYEENTGLFTLTNEEEIADRIDAINKEIIENCYVSILFNDIEILKVYPLWIEGYYYKKNCFEDLRKSNRTACDRNKYQTISGILYTSSKGKFRKRVDICLGNTEKSLEANEDDNCFFSILLKRVSVNEFKFEGSREDFYQNKLYLELEKKNINLKSDSNKLGFKLEERNDHIESTREERIGIVSLKSNFTNNPNRGRKDYFKLARKCIKFINIF